MEVVELNNNYALLTVSSNTTILDFDKEFGEYEETDGDIAL